MAEIDHLAPFFPHAISKMSNHKLIICGSVGSYYTQILFPVIKHATTSKLQFKETKRLLANSPCKTKLRPLKWRSKLVSCGREKYLV